MDMGPTGRTHHAQQRLGALGRTAAFAQCTAEESALRAAVRAYLSRPKPRGVRSVFVGARARPPSPIQYRRLSAARRPPAKGVRNSIPFSRFFALVTC
jgi:hypothetical protein